MTRQIHDQFSKEILAELIKPLGQVGVNREIHAETYHADLSFIPSPSTKVEDFDKLGLLGRMVKTPCLIEYFWKPPTLAEIRSCLLKLYAWHSQSQREAKVAKEKLSDEALPQLWIVTTTLPTGLSEKCSLTLKLSEWGEGVYFFCDLFKTAIVAIDQLPSTTTTLWLRLLGKATVQKQAVDTFVTWAEQDHSMARILEIVYKWCVGLDTKPNLTSIEKELLMNLSAAYEEARQKAVQQGIQQGVQQGVQQGRLEERREWVKDLLKSRFKRLDKALSTLVEPLSNLSSKECSRLLLQLSRSELIEKFGKP